MASRKKENALFHLFILRLTKNIDIVKVLFTVFHLCVLLYRQLFDPTRKYYKCVF